MALPRPYDRTTFDGRRVDERTKWLLKETEKETGPLQLLQGSYNAGGVKASSGTHDGGGAIDVWGKNPDKIVRTLRENGFAAWHRRPNQGPWGEHIHAVDSGNARLSAGAKAQVAAYKAGRNGLANHGRDDGPRIPLVPKAYPSTRLPAVSLTNVANQARTGGKRKLVGVERIQRALNAEGAHLTVDGHFGPATKRAYAAYEKKVGGDGDGIPGSFSLGKLGRGRFSVRKT